MKKYGNKRLYRQYLIDNGPHVDAHADGKVDFDFNGTWGDEGAQNELTPLQAYAQRAFAYLVDWVERGRRPPKSCMVATNPADDITDPELLEWYPPTPTQAPIRCYASLQGIGAHHALIPNAKTQMSNEGILPMLDSIGPHPPFDIWILSFDIWVEIITKPGYP